jgi:monofunctional biosynthetic peptidoglycan transglycosylase
MELLFVLAAVAAETSPTRPVFDFSSGDEPWRNIDDTVMGGRSASGMRIEEGRGVFAGNVSLENNGGFASVRSIPADHDLSGRRGVVIRFRGDGKIYGLRIKTDRRYDGVSYQAEIATVDGEWREIRLPFNEFRPIFRGRTVPGYAALDPASIKSFGLMISRKQEGPFRLEIDWIRAYGER